MRFHLHIRMFVVKVEAIQVGIDSLDGGLACKVAAPASSNWVLADSGLPGVSTGDFVSGAEQAHRKLQARGRVMNLMSCGMRVALASVLKGQPGPAERTIQKTNGLGR